MLDVEQSRYQFQLGRLREEPKMWLLEAPLKIPPGEDLHAKDSLLLNHLLTRGQQSQYPHPSTSIPLLKGDIGTPFSKQNKKPSHITFPSHSVRPLFSHSQPNCTGKHLNCIVESQFPAQESLPSLFCGCSHPEPHLQKTSDWLLVPLHRPWHCRNVGISGTT